jgi:hypothetical protein
MPRLLLPPRKDPVPIAPPGPVWTGAENLAPTGIRSPDRPACSQSLYRLSYPSPLLFLVTEKSEKDNVPSRTAKYSKMSLKFKYLMETGLTGQYSSQQRAKGCKQSRINIKNKL